MSGLRGENIGSKITAGSCARELERQGKTEGGTVAKNFLTSSGIACIIILLGITRPWWSFP